MQNRQSRYNINKIVIYYIYEKFEFNFINFNFRNTL
jgi:hypothetical protein